MKFNHRELGLISTQWNSTFEGILLLRQKIDTFFKRSGRTLFDEHWCRLKGNLLVILRSSDRHSVDLLGVIILEHCSVSLSADVGVQHAFQIEFDSSDSPILLAARSAAEAKMWCGHIASAGISELSARRSQLCEELHKITGKDPLDQLNQSSHKFSIAPDEDDISATGLELSLSLICDRGDAKIIGNGVKIVVSIQDAETCDWDLIAETEVESDESPIFLKAVKINPKRYLNSSIISFRLFEFEDIGSSASRFIGFAVTTLDDLSKNTCLQLAMMESNETATQGNPFLIVKIKHFSSTREHSPIDLHSCQLQSLCTNILTQNYVFYNVLGDLMHIVEYMGESKLSFQLPIDYLKCLIKQDHLLFDSLSRTGISDTTLECFRRERLLGMKGIIERYEICLHALVDHTGPNIKRSTERNNAELDFVPTNLHVNRIGLLDSEGTLISFHDITSVGAFSSASTRYKCRGLFQTAFSMLHEMGSNPISQSSDLNLSDLASRNPMIAAALHWVGHPVGVAIKNISEGADLVVRFCGDLLELKSRLQAAGQASLLAERLELMMKKINAIFSTSGAVSSLQLASMNRDFETLLHKIIEIADLEKFEIATSYPNTGPLNPSSADMLIQKIGPESNTLEKSIRASWECIEEFLWSLILESVANNCSKSDNAETHVSATSSTSLAELSNVWDNLHYRHHAAVCQALCASLTGLAISVTHWTTAHWEQMISCGVPIHFECLLSCFGEELNMLDNWSWAIQFLCFWRLTVRPFMSTSSHPLGQSKECASSSPPQNLPLAQLTEYKECVLFVPSWVWKNTPSEYQTRGRLELKFHPYAFNVGINEQQTIAERLERTGLQTMINNRGLTSLQSYFEKYTRKFGAPARTPTKQDVCDAIGSLKHTLLSSRSKPVEILELAAEISQSLNAVRLTSCKSAKDRTAMSISLEQTRWLRDVEWMKPETFTSALKCLRSTGLRLSNVERNIGVRKYAFTRFQLLSFPKIYRPPIGTYSLHVQS